MLFLFSLGKTLTAKGKLTDINTKLSFKGRNHPWNCVENGEEVLNKKKYKIKKKVFSKILCTLPLMVSIPQPFPPSVPIVHHVFACISHRTRFNSSAKTFGSSIATNSGQSTENLRIFYRCACMGQNTSQLSCRVHCVRVFTHRVGYCLGYWLFITGRSSHQAIRCLLLRCTWWKCFEDVGRSQRTQKCHRF